MGKSWENDVYTGDEPRKMLFYEVLLGFHGIFNGDNYKIKWL
jgi:hypothetical protein